MLFKAGSRRNESAESFWEGRGGGAAELSIMKRVFGKCFTCTRLLLSVNLWGASDFKGQLDKRW